jgi:hypothetical protein
MKKERYIPAGYALSYIHEGTEFVVYQHEQEGRLYAIAYAGKATRPLWHYRFKSAESLAKQIEESISSLGARKAAVKARRAARYAPHRLMGGEIFRTSWGYDQTNVEYYQVVGVKGQSVELCEVAQMREETGFMSGECAPVPGQFIGKPFTRQVSMESGSPRVKIHQSAYGYLESPFQVISGVPIYKKRYFSYYA